MAPPRSSPTVRVIIVNYNGLTCLPRCVEALKAQAGIGWECVLVDNGSTDGSLEEVRPLLDARFRVIEAGENLGFAAANNRGAEGAGTRWLATLNPDAFAREDWLANLVAGAEATGARMAGSTQIQTEKPNFYDGLGDGYHISGLAWRMGFGHLSPDVPDSPYPVFGPCAAAALYDRKLFERVAGFDETFFCYHEDVDLALRMRRAGATAVQVPDAIVDHVGSAITGRASEFAVFHGTRNRMWTFVTSMPLAGLILLGPLHIAMTLAMMVWSLFRPGRASPTWRGVLAGLHGLPARLAKRGEVSRDVGLWGLWPALTLNPVVAVRRTLSIARERP